MQIAKVDGTSEDDKDVSTTAETSSTTAGGPTRKWLPTSISAFGEYLMACISGMLTQSCFTVLMNDMLAILVTTGVELFTIVQQADLS